MQTRLESPLPVYEDSTIFDSLTEDSSKSSLLNRHTGFQGAASEQNTITSKSLSDYSFLPPPPSLPSFVLDSPTTRPEMPAESNITSPNPLPVPGHEEPKYARVDIKNKRILHNIEKLNDLSSQ